jgi:hypothetical protein
VEEGANLGPFMVTEMLHVEGEANEKSQSERNDDDSGNLSDDPSPAKRGGRFKRRRFTSQSGSSQPENSRATARPDIVARRQMTIPTHDDHPLFGPYRTDCPITGLSRPIKREEAPVVVSSRLLIFFRADTHHRS